MLYALIGLVLGAAGVYLWRASREAQLTSELTGTRAQLADAIADGERRILREQEHHSAVLHQHLEAAAQRLEDLKRHYEERLAAEVATRERVQTDFKAAAAEELASSAKQFLESAIKDLRQVKSEAGSDIEKQKQEITTSVLDMKSRLEEYQRIVKTFEEERSTVYARLDSQLGILASSGEAWKQEAAALRSALTTGSATSGRWGERVLETILTTNGLHAGIHFEMQSTLENGDGKTLRPDFIITLPPGEHRQVIDAKSSLLDSFIAAQASDDGAVQARHLEEFARTIRTRVRDLSNKEYQTFVDPAVPYVIMFIPSEAAIRAAFSTDTELFQDAASKRVIIASPVTIIPLILLIAHAWQQQTLADNATQLGEAVDELGNRIVKFVEHLSDVREGLGRAQRGWNNAVGSWQTRLTPQLEKARQLGGRLKDIESLKDLPAELKILPPSPDSDSPTTGDDSVDSNT